MRQISYCYLLFLFYVCTYIKNKPIHTEIFLKEVVFVFWEIFYFCFCFKYRGNKFSVVVNLMSFHYSYYSVNCNRKHAVLKNSPTDIECT